MIETEHAFDPVLIASSLHAIRLNNNAGNGGSDNDDFGLTVPHVLDSRTLFYQLNQPNQIQNLMPSGYSFIARGLREAERTYSSLLVQDYSEEHLAQLKPLNIVPLPERLSTQDNIKQCVKQFAVIELTKACWLQNIFQVSCSQMDYAIDLLSIYKQLSKVEPGEGNYRGLLLSIGEDTPVLHHHSFSQQPEIISCVFDFASTQLALALFPRVLFAEILGFTLAFCQMPSLIENCFPHHQISSSFFKLRQKCIDGQLSPLLACIKAYLNQFPQHKEFLWHRVQNGFWLYHLQMQACRDQLKSVMSQPLSPQLAVSRLFQNNAMAAIGHHQRIQLSGQTLDSWFAGMPENNQAFLQALTESDYVNTRNPSESRLLKLFDFNGPMYGVFDQAEIQVLQNWLNDSLSDKVSSIVTEPEKSVNLPSPSKRLIKEKDYSKLNNKHLYYYLVNADLFPDLLPVVRTKLDKLLRVCNFFNPPPFKHYSHQKLDLYIENIYQREMGAYQPLVGKPKISREAYVWGIEQIAPMILIDGCWLQNSLALQNVNPEISEILFSIYCDEIGNGCLQQNHPFIFQQLLNSLSISVPPVYSIEFIKHTRFINSAFDLPVYMLALSNFSVEFLPELLGLNMAIELSGLGKGYMGLVDDWNYWGIDSTIANIHISIDNYASGHTFLAKKAIQLYLDNVIKHTGNPFMLDTHWRRIYSGYASLRFFGGRFKRVMPICYFVEKCGQDKKR